MISPVQKILFPALPYDKKEILRYAGCERETEDFSPLFQACLEEAKGTFTPQVAYLKTNVTIRESLCDFGVFSFRSEHLSRLLKDCDEAVLFAATVGIGIDRLILRNTKISPTKALLFSAIGSQQVEALCDTFCEALKKEGYDTLPRFSPGYGDVPLELQRDFLPLFEKSGIGIALSDGNLMTPTKSVTAFVGIRK